MAGAWETLWEIVAWLWEIVARLSEIVAWLVLGTLLVPVDWGRPQLQCWIHVLCADIQPHAHGYFTELELCITCRGQDLSVVLTTAHC